MSGSGLTAEQLKKKEDDRAKQKSPLAWAFGIGLGDGSGEDTSGDESEVEFGKQVATTKTAEQIAADMKAKTVEQFEKGTPIQTETLEAKKVAPTVAKKVEGGGEGKEQEGGVMHWLGLAGGRKRRRKKSRKKKKKSKSKKRRRKSRRRSRSRKKRGGFGCGSESKSDPRTPCPPIEKMWMGCDMGMLTACHSGRDAARGNSKSPDGGQMWYDYMYTKYVEGRKKGDPKKMKKYAMRMKKFVEHLTKTKHRAMIPVTTDNAMKKGTGGESADWGWWSVPGSQNIGFGEKSYEEKYTNMLRKTGLPDGRQNGHLPAPVPSNPQGAVGGRRRKSRRKKRRKSKKRKSRRRRKKSRKRRR